MLHISSFILIFRSVSVVFEILTLWNCLYHTENGQYIVCINETYKMYDNLGFRSALLGDFNACMPWCCVLWLITTLVQGQARAKVMLIVSAHHHWRQVELNSQLATLEVYYFRFMQNKMLTFDLWSMTNWYSESCTGSGWFPFLNMDIFNFSIFTIPSK